MAETEVPDPYFSSLRAEVESADRPPFETVQRRARRRNQRRSAVLLLLVLVALLVALAMCS